MTTQRFALFPAAMAFALMLCNLQADTASGDGKVNATREIERLTGLEEVAITRILPHKISVTHKFGGKSISYEELTPELRSHFHMTPEKAERSEAHERDTFQKTRRSLALARFADESRVTITGTVYRAFEDGVILLDATLSRGEIEPIIVERSVVTDGPSALNPRRCTAYRTIKETHLAEVVDAIDGVVYIAVPKNQLAEGTPITAIVFPHGVYRFSTLTGETRTAPAFGEDVELSWAISSGMPPEPKDLRQLPVIALPEVSNLATTPPLRADELYPNNAFGYQE